MGTGGVDMMGGMGMNKGWMITIVAASLALACTDPGNMNMDMMPTDSGTAIPLDAGVRALCPLGSQATCQSSTECGEVRPPPSNCSGCIPYNRSICRLGQCETPEPLMSSDPVNYLFQVDSLNGTLQSFAGIIIMAESSGGQTWTCDDVYSKKLDLTSMCHNILDTRGQDIGVADNQYTMTFTRFVANQPTLFIVYGYADPEAEGMPVGVSCSLHQVGSPGSGKTMIPGDTMRRIQ
jgi:hypothetical protein